MIVPKTILMVLAIRMGILVLATRKIPEMDSKVAINSEVTR